MTNEQINIAIAEACGWDSDDIARGYTLCQFTEYVPDYCNDLNAMHEAEKVLMRADLLFEYGMHISIDHKYDYLLRATARQRAEAFLRTLGKWEQSGDATEMVKEVQK